MAALINVGQNKERFGKAGQCNDGQGTARQGGAAQNNEWQRSVREGKARSSARQEAVRVVGLGKD